jgi:tRNA (cmo5U34)-methyltransferase
MHQGRNFAAGKRCNVWHRTILHRYTHGVETIPQDAWESQEAVEYYSRTADLFVPGRREMVSLISRLATENASETPRILDLGCGSGDVTAGILRYRPHAYALLVDISEEMIRLSRDRFQKDPDIRILRHNLNEELLDATPERQFDAVVSCLALHHTAFEKRVGLYRSIWEVLKPGGLFINGDQFKSESPVIDQWEFDSWIEGTVSRMRDQGTPQTFDEVKNTQLGICRTMEDKPGTVWEMQNDMREAGFSTVDCVWKLQNFAILVAEK